MRGNDRVERDLLAESAPVLVSSEVKPLVQFRPYTVGGHETIAIASPIVVQHPGGIGHQEYHRLATTEPGSHRIDDLRIRRDLRPHRLVFENLVACANMGREDGPAGKSLPDE